MWQVRSINLTVLCVILSIDAQIYVLFYAMEIMYHIHWSFKMWNVTFLKNYSCFVCLTNRFTILSSKPLCTKHLSILQLKLLAYLNRASVDNQANPLVYFPTLFCFYYFQNRCNFRQIATSRLPACNDWKIFMITMALYSSTQILDHFLEHYVLLRFLFHYFYKCLYTVLNRQQIFQS